MAYGKSVEGLETDKNQQTKTPTILKQKPERLPFSYLVGNVASTLKLGGYERHVVWRPLSYVRIRVVILLGVVWKTS